MKRSYIFGGVSAVLLASAAIYAAPGDGKAKVDADGNGVITKTEAMVSADAHFAKMDANSDGTLNDADRGAMVKRHFSRIDTDKNGSISETEFIASHEARASKREIRGERVGLGNPDGHRMGGRGKGMGDMHAMQGLDANNDKIISKAEFRMAAEERFAISDTNKDGSISSDERRAMRGARPDMPSTPATPDAG